MTPSDAYDLPRLRPLLKPFRLHYRHTLRSTSDAAIALRRREALFAPAVVLCSRQTAGRGRGGRTWWHAPIGLAVTFALPLDEQRRPEHVPLLAGVAVRRAVASVGVEAQLKWPNDLQVNGRKLAGLLCERREGLDLIGIGLNVAFAGTSPPAELADHVTALDVHAPEPPTRQTVLTAVARELATLLLPAGELSLASVVDEYEQHHALTGRRVTATRGEEQTTGLCRGIDHAGRLVLDTSTGPIRLTTATVRPLA